MSKSNKIIVIAISVTVAICLAVIAITSITSKKDGTDTSVTASEAVPAESVTDANGAVQDTTEVQTSEDIVSAESTSPTEGTITTTVPTTAAGESSTASSSDLSGAILGKWMDSAGMSGFEFFPNGKVSYTYVNLSSFGVPFDGTARNALYTLEGNKLNIKFSIYVGTIDKEYEISIENDVLSMKDLEEKNTATYVRVKDETTTSVAIPTVSAPSTAQSETTAPATTAVPAVGLEGRFLNGDKKSEITFNSDGTVNIKIKRDDFSGVYQVTGDKVLIVYIDDGESISEEYSYELNGNILTLTSSKGEASVYVKQ